MSNQKRRVAQAKTKAEAAMTVAGEKSMALTVYDKGDQELGELYLEAVGKAEIDYYQGKKSNPAPLKDIMTLNENAYLNCVCKKVPCTKK